jgi:hypothetical protein
MESVDHHARVGPTLGRILSHFIAEAEAEFCSEPVPAA